MPVATDEDVLETITRRIVDGFDPDLVVLFGSRARGDAGAESDYDILIIADSPAPRWERTYPVHRAVGDVDVSVDLIWWTREEIEEWSEVRSHLITRAMSEGRVLYEKDAARSRRDALEARRG